MDVSIFEIVGPVMMGPSSSATAGMARIGATVHKFIRSEVSGINLRFTPRFTGKYAGSRSHAAIIGGVLGLSEDDARLKNAIAMARELGIELTSSIFPEPAPEHALTVEVTVRMKNGETCVLRAISVGGGSIEVLSVDGFQTKLSGTEAYVFLWTDKAVDTELSSAFPGSCIGHDEISDKHLYYVSVPHQTAKESEDKAAALPFVVRTLFMPPVIAQGYVPHTPLFTTFEELLKLSGETGKSVPELALMYEERRSGRSKKEIRNQMAHQYEVMKSSMIGGLEKEIVPLYGFNKGDGGKRVQKAYKEGRTMGGTVLPRALAIALASMEYGGSMSGCIVAAPTGASGTLPGCLLSVQEERDLTDEQIIDAMLIGAAVGVIIRHHGSTFSGSAGGCQAEVGVTSAMAAAGMVYLGGGGTGQIIQAAALAIKNIMGLICDPIGCAEIPCIKRNGVGVANAFTAGDMALSGLESFIPPDEVIESFVGVQKILPVEMRGAGCGATGTKTAKEAQKIIDAKNIEIALPLV